MSRPDLSDPDARSAYRRELMSLHSGRRLCGLLLMLAGQSMILWPVFREPSTLGPLPIEYWGWGFIAIGGLVLASVIAARTRYNRRRMDEPQGD